MILKGLSVAKNCLKPESAPLMVSFIKKSKRIQPNALIEAMASSKKKFLSTTNLPQFISVFHCALISRDP